MVEIFWIDEKDLMMSLVAIGALSSFICLYLLVKILNLASPCSMPDLHTKDTSSSFMRNILATCPILFETYIPPLLWGKSGHLQTIIYAKMGRIKSPLPLGERLEKEMPDKATMTFDIFQPDISHPSGRDYSLVVCPGIANSSENLYIRTLVNHAQSNGYRIAVLNHLGALKNVRLTSPRIFNYGETGEYNCMIDEMIRLYPDSTLIAVGCSMGANIVLKYLGENPDHEKKVLGGISLCQGYDANDVKQFLLGWEKCRRIYSYFMAVNLRQLIRHHKDILFGEEAEKKYGPIDFKGIYSASSLLEIDELYSRKIALFKNHTEYYHWASCKQYIHNITKPLFILNAEDDPIIPSALHRIPLQYLESNDKCLFVTTKHGGHLGYFEGGFFQPNTITWLDRAVVQFSNSLCNMHGNGEIL